MKLWVDGEEGSAGSAVRAKVSEVTADINRQVASRGVRVVNALRDAELRVLKGQRSGRRYRTPYTGSRTPQEKRKKKYKPPMYTASAPGEPPARRTGNLRMHWNWDVKKGTSQTAA